MIERQFFQIQVLVFFVPCWNLRVIFEKFCELVAQHFTNSILTCLLRAIYPNEVRTRFKTITTGLRCFWCDCAPVSFPFSFCFRWSNADHSSLSIKVLRVSFVTRRSRISAYLTVSERFIFILQDNASRRSYRFKFYLCRTSEVKAFPALQVVRDSSCHLQLPLRILHASMTTAVFVCLYCTYVTPVRRRYILIRLQLNLKTVWVLELIGTSAKVKIPVYHGSQL